MSKETDDDIGIIEGLLAVGFLGWLIHTGKKEKKIEDEEDNQYYNAKIERRSCTCEYNEWLTEHDFYEIAVNAGKKVKRIQDISVNNGIITCTVVSQSGMTEWEFEVDFNDYGVVTEKYWIYSENDNSEIPNYYAKKVVELMKQQKPVHEENDFLQTEEAVFCNNEAFAESVREDSTGAFEFKKGKSVKSNQSQFNIKKTFSFLRVMIKMFFIILVVVSAVSVVLYVKELIGIKIGVDSDMLIGMKYQDAISIIHDNGFSNVHAVPEYDLEYSEKNLAGTVYNVSPNDFSAETRFPKDKRIVLQYHWLKQIASPLSSKDIKGKNYKKIVKKFKKAGFSEIKVKESKDLVLGFFHKDGEIKSITINGKKDFDKNDIFYPDAKVKITYHTFK